MRGGRFPVVMTSVETQGGFCLGAKDQVAVHGLSGGFTAQIICVEERR